MAVDTPATIAILGAGPVGIEAGLYARYLGYRVVIFEQGEIANHVLAWGHVQMLSPFCQLRSSLGLAALKAQDPSYRPPEPDARLTGRQWVDAYVLPLSRTDLLADEIRCQTRAVAVGRASQPVHDGAPDARDGESGFRVLVEQAGGRQACEQADIVIDCTGVYGDPNWCGVEGVSAVDEPAAYDVVYEGLSVSSSFTTGDRGAHGTGAAVDGSQDGAALPPARLITPEPNFYILGAKRFGREARFLITDGLRQIRDLFGIIGGRAELDLYVTVEKLAQ